MKATINGKRYDVEKSSKIAEDRDGSPRDFGHWVEALYMTPRGKSFFLHGIGGPRSQYAVSHKAGEWSGGEKIIPMTREEAMSWCEKRGQTKVIETHFSDLVQDA